MSWMGLSFILRGAAFVCLRTYSKLASLHFAKSSKLSENDVQINCFACKAGGIDGKTFGNAETSGEVNMRVSIAMEDIIGAGGFGARDDISSFFLLQVT
ncbi:hypothetical protein PTKIN_Ptkin13bG0211000 [Pterospermum kingtungense]